MENRSLVYSKETLYFLFCCLVSGGVYISAFFSLFLLPFLAGLLFLSLFFHALMMGSLRLNSVRVSEQQFPDVHEKIQHLSGQMGLAKVPDVFVVQSEGALNAFATRFLGRNVVVLYSEIFELARQQGQKELEFIIAHELAHLKRRHIWKSWLIMPAMWVPFLAEAYSRAAEHTCDRYAAHYIEDGPAAKRALTILAVGKVLYREVNEQAYVQQIEQEANPFVWLAEKLSTHPALPKRIQHIGRFLKMPDATNYEAPMKKVAGGLAALVFTAAVVGGGAVYAAMKIDPALFSADFLEEELSEETDLMTAASAGDLASISYLIEENADLDEVNSIGETALHYAVLEDDAEAAQLLLAAGADPNVEDEAAFTPLWLAYESRNVEMTKLLLQYGANPDQEDVYGETLRSIVKDEGETEFLQLFPK